MLAQTQGQLAVCLQIGVLGSRDRITGYLWPVTRVFEWLTDDHLAKTAQLLVGSKVVAIEDFAQLCPTVRF
jgi:hypothetical protein